jgi:hypothetical protein
MALITQQQKTINELLNKLSTKKGGQFKLFSLILFPNKIGGQNKNRN